MPSILPSALVACALASSAGARARARGLYSRAYDDEPSISPLPDDPDEEFALKLSTLKTQSEAWRASTCEPLYAAQHIELLPANVVATVDLPLEYEVAFTLKLHSVARANAYEQHKWQSILHISATNENIGEPGSRVPGVWLWPGTSNLLVTNDHGTVQDDRCDHGQPIPVGSEVRVVIQIDFHSVVVAHNNEVVCAEFGRGPQPGYRGAKLYMTDAGFFGTSKYIVADADVTDIAIRPLRCPHKPWWQTRHPPPHSRRDIADPRRRPSFKPGFSQRASSLANSDAQQTITPVDDDEVKTIGAAPASAVEIGGAAATDQSVGDSLARASMSRHDEDSIHQPTISKSLDSDAVLVILATIGLVTTAALAAIGATTVITKVMRRPTSEPSRAYARVGMSEVADDDSGISADMANNSAPATANSGQHGVEMTSLPACTARNDAASM